MFCALCRRVVGSLELIMGRYGSGMVAGEAPFNVETTQLAATVIRVESTERTLSVVPFSGATALNVILPATISGGWTASVVLVPMAPFVPDAEFLSLGGVVTWLRSADRDGRKLSCTNDGDFCLSITQRIVVRLGAGEASSSSSFPSSSSVAVATLNIKRKLELVKARLGLRCVVHIRAGGERRAGLSSDVNVLPNAAEPGWYWSDDYCQVKSVVLDADTASGTVRRQFQSWRLCTMAHAPFGPCHLSVPTDPFERAA
jgi:hypothetical protein